jgi:hypothetical protein
MASEDSPKNSTSSTAREWLVTIVGILALAAFAVFINYLVTQTGATDVVWARLTYLLSGVEAVVFAAVGFLFGREVHRERAITAEAKADTANAESKTAKETAAQASERAIQAEGAVQAIVNQINVKRDAYQTKGPLYAALGATPTAQISQEDFEELARFAANYASK